MAINLHQINEHEKKKAAQQAEVKPDMTQPMYDRRPLDVSVTQPFKDMKQLAEKPTLERYDVDELERNARSQYIQSFDNWADASKDGSFSQQEWASKQIEKAIAEGKNPGDYLYLTQLMGSAETPDEIKKRERRNALGETFRNLGSLIGNVANLYYTNKGGQYIDLNTANEKHRERMQRLKDKQDVLAEKRNNILINAKLGDLRNTRAEKAKQEEREYNEKMADKKYENQSKRDAFKAEKEVVKLQIQDKLKRGIIDAQTASKLIVLAEKAKDSLQVEAVKQEGRENLKTTPSGGYKAGESAYGSDGTIYTREKKLSDKEAKEIVLAHVPSDELAAFETTDADGNVKTDWEAAAAYATQKGYVSNEELEGRGYKANDNSSTKKTKKTIDGFGTKDNKSNKKTISGF